MIAVAGRDGIDSAEIADIVVENDPIAYVDWDATVEERIEVEVDLAGDQEQIEVLLYRHDLGPILNVHKNDNQFWYD